MDTFIDLFDPLPIAVLFAIFIAAGLVFILRTLANACPRPWSPTTGRS